ncbi:MAG: Nif3-like dinuclear metal center hexameric protein, partial [Proteobacteria bacterium SW_6_67_9]
MTGCWRRWSVRSTRDGSGRHRCGRRERAAPCTLPLRWHGSDGMIETPRLVEYLDDLLGAASIRDYAPNGWQLEGSPRIERLMTGVTACQPLLEAAAAWGADALLVHHGWFWKNEPAAITGMKHRRVRTALEANCNLLAYHLPLDVHPVFGNNAHLGRRLGATVAGQSEVAGVPGLLWHGHLAEPVGESAFAARIEQGLAREPTWVSAGHERIRSVAWCTGGGQDFVDAAADMGVEAFVTGEISERTTHCARERGVAFFAAGH